MAIAFIRGSILACLTSVIPLTVLGAPQPYDAHAQPLLRVSMMGGGMMGSGMMGNGSGTTTSNGASSKSSARQLEAFIDNQHLRCFSCHAVSNKRMGPSFAAIANRYAGDANAANILAHSITHGVSGKWSNYGGMPSGLATSKQARELAHLIMGLAGDK